MDDVILFVDGSKEVLNTASKLLNIHGIDILTVDNANSALDIFFHQDIAVVVSGGTVPGDTGLDFLIHLKEISPDTVKILMTDKSDLPRALKAIDRNEIYRSILKPLQEEELLCTVVDGIRRHREFPVNEKAEKYVFNSIKQAIELKDTYTKAHCDRVSSYASMIADALLLPKDMKKEIINGSRIHDCGKIGVTETILNGSQRLNCQEFETIKMHPVWGMRLAAMANLSLVARNIIYYHHENFDGTGYPTGIGGKNIPIEARIVSVANVFDALINDRPYRKKYSLDETVAILKSMQGKFLDPELVEIFQPIVARTHVELSARISEQASAGATCTYCPDD